MFKASSTFPESGPTLFGRNGEGDLYYNLHGEIYIASLSVDGIRRTAPPETIPTPPLFALKIKFGHGVVNSASQ